MKLLSALWVVLSLLPAAAWLFLAAAWLFPAAAWAQEMEWALTDPSAGSFVENRGQIAQDRPFAESIFAMTRIDDLDVVFAEDRMWMHLSRYRVAPDALDGEDAPPVRNGGVLFDVSWGNSAAPSQMPELDGQVSSYSNYFLGNEPSDHFTHVRQFSGLRYPDAWPGIDLRFAFDDSRNLFYTLRLAPGASPNGVEFRAEGADSVEIDAEGSLRLTSEKGAVVQSAPRAWQVVNGREVAVEVGFVLRGESGWGFTVGHYDPSLPLFIDPTVTADRAGYEGPSSGGFRASAVDSAGNLYVTGGVGDMSLPATAGAYDETYAGGGWPDMSAMKLDPDGTVVWATYVGGRSEDYSYVCSIDDANRFIIGGRAGDGYPTTAGAFDRTFNGGIGAGSVHDPTDAFVTRLAPDGASLVYSTLIGGGGDDNSRAIHLLPSGEVIVGGGNSTTTNLPVSAGAYRNTRGGGRDGWVAKVAADGSGLVFMTYFGATDDSWSSGPDETIRSLGVDASGNVWIGGTTAGTAGLPPTADAIQSRRGGALRTETGYVAKLSPDGRRVVYQSWIGGAGFDEIETEGVSDSAGNFYIAGGTRSADFPVSTGAFQETLRGGWDAFLLRVDNDGSLGWSTLWGGTGTANENFFGPVVGASGTVYTAGRSESSDRDLTSASAPQRDNAGGKDALFAMFSSDGRTLEYATLYGGNRVDFGRHVAVTADETVAYLVGETGSTDLAVRGGGSGTARGGFIAKFLISPTTPPMDGGVPGLDGGPSDGGATDAGGVDAPGSDVVAVDGSNPDSGMTIDSSTGTDAGAGPADEGCGCSSASPASSFPTFAVLLGLWWVRRRRGTDRRSR